MHNLLLFPLLFCIYHLNSMEITETPKKENISPYHAQPFFSQQVNDSQVKLFALPYPIQPIDKIKAQELFPHYDFTKSPDNYFHALSIAVQVENPTDSTLINTSLLYQWLKTDNESLHNALYLTPFKNNELTNSIESVKSVISHHKIIEQIPAGSFDQHTINSLIKEYDTLENKLVQLKEKYPAIPLSHSEESKDLTFKNEPFYYKRIHFSKTNRRYLLTLTALPQPITPMPSLEKLPVYPSFNSPSTTLYLLPIVIRLTSTTQYERTIYTSLIYEWFNTNNQPILNALDLRPFDNTKDKKIIKFLEKIQSNNNMRKKIKPTTYVASAIQDTINHCIIVQQQISIFKKAIAEL